MIYILSGLGGGGGILVGILRGGVLPCSPNPDTISDQKYVILQTCFQTRPPKSIPVFRPVLWAPDLAFRQKLRHHYLDSVCKQKNSSNAFQIRIFLLLSYSFGIETINMFIHSHSTLENHTRFQTNMGKVYTCFQTKTRPGGAAHTYIACIREYPPRIYMDSRALWMGHSKTASGMVPGQRDKSDKKNIFYRAL